MRVRNEQINEFEKRDASRFEDAMIKHIAACYPEENADLIAKGGPEAPRKLVRDTIERGEKYNITTEQAVAGLIDLTVAFGRDFEFTPEMSWTHEILTDEEMGGKAKIDMIFHLLPEE